MVGWAQHNMVFDESGIGVYCEDAGQGLKFLSVPGSLSPKLLYLSTG